MREDFYCVKPIERVLNEGGGTEIVGYVLDGVEALLFGKRPQKEGINLQSGMREHLSFRPGFFVRLQDGRVVRIIGIRYDKIAFTYKDMRGIVPKTEVTDIVVGDGPDTMADVIRAENLKNGDYRIYPLHHVVIGIMIQSQNGTPTAMNVYRGELGLSQTNVYSTTNVETIMAMCRSLPRPATYRNVWGEYTEDGTNYCVRKVGGSGSLPLETINAAFKAVNIKIGR